MEFFVNILTLTACFATMAYCYVLAKRIHAFRNMKDGMGALIEEMIRTTSDLQTAFNTTQKNIDRQYHKIQDKIDEAVILNEYLTDILKNIETTNQEMHILKSQITQTQHTKKNDTHYAPKNNSTHRIKHSTLPDSFQLASIQQDLHKTESYHTESYHTQSDMNNTEADPLADVMPADFDSLQRKKRHNTMIPGEKYL